MLLYTSGLTLIDSASVSLTLWGPLREDEVRMLLLLMLRSSRALPSDWLELMIAWGSVEGGVSEEYSIFLITADISDVVKSFLCCPSCAMLSLSCLVAEVPSGWWLEGSGGSGSGGSGEFEGFAGCLVVSDDDWIFDVWIGEWLGHVACGVLGDSCELFYGVKVCVSEVLVGVIVVGILIDCGWHL